MFTLHFNNNNRYEVTFLDNSVLVLSKGVEDTPALRRELAKLAHRIAAREFVLTHKDYVADWPANAHNLSLDQLKNISEAYQYFYYVPEAWDLLDSYEHPDHHQLSQYHRDTLREKELLDSLIKEKNESGAIKDN